MVGSQCRIGHPKWPHRMLCSQELQVASVRIQKAFPYQFFNSCMRCLWPWSSAVPTSIAQALHGARLTTCFWPWSGVVQGQMIRTVAANPEPSLHSRAAKAPFFPPTHLDPPSSYIESFPTQFLAHPVRMSEVFQLNFLWLI